MVSLRLMVVSLYTINQITFYIEKDITTCGELVVKLMFVQCIPFFLYPSII